MNKKRGVLLTIIFGVNTVASLFIQIIVAKYFGTSNELGNYLVAVTIPSTLTVVFYATINDVFMPIYTKALHRDRNDAKLTASSWLIGLSKIGAILSMLLYVFAGYISRYMFHNFSVETMYMIRFMSIAPLVSIVNALLMSINYANDRFYVPPSAQFLGSVVNIFILLVSYRYIHIYALPASFVGGIFVQLLLLSVDSGKFVNLKKYKNISIKNLLLLWLPILVSYLFYKSDYFLIRSSAMKVGSSYVSTVNYAVGVIVASAGLSTIGVRVLLMPLLTKTIAENDVLNAKRIVRKSHAIGFVLSLLNILFWFVFGRYLLKYVFVGGEFTLETLDSVMKSLKLFLPSVFGWSMFSLFTTPFYAVKKQKFVAVVTTIGFLLGFSLSYIADALYMDYSLLPYISVFLMFMFDILLLGGRWYLYEEGRL